MLKKLARRALDIQDACNLTALAQGFAPDMLELRRLVGSEIATHPITIIWLDKMNSLAGIQELGNERVMEAFTACWKIVEAPDPGASTTAPEAASSCASGAPTPPDPEDNCPRRMH